MSQSPRRSDLRYGAVGSAKQEPRRTSRVRRFALYWCTTPDGGEDWFVVAASARQARHFHEDAEGYDRGEAHAERVQALLPQLLVDEGWRDGPHGEVQSGPNWPSDELLVACGAEIASQSRDRRRDAMGVVCKDVRFGERLFRAGDIVADVARAHGIHEPARLSVFKGSRGGGTKRAP